MRLMRTAAVLVLAGLLAAGCIARSPEIFHTPDRLDRWARVAAIPPGAEVRAWRLGSETAEPGRFVRAGDEELVLEGNAGTAAVFLRERVARVSVVSGRPYRRYLGNGFRTGLLFAAAVMGIALAAEGGDIPLYGVAGIIGSGGVWGAVIGAIGAGGTPATTVVFEAPDADAPPTPRGLGGPSPLIETPDADPLPADAAQSRVALPRPTPGDDDRGARSRGCCGDVDDATRRRGGTAPRRVGPSGRWADGGLREAAYKSAPGARPSGRMARDVVEATGVLSE